MLSHNRLVFATSISITAMAAIGLQTISNGARWRAWGFLPAGLAFALCLVAAVRAKLLPSSLETRLEAAIAEMPRVGWRRDGAAIAAAKSAFSHAQIAGAILCGMAGVLWLVFRRRAAPRWVIPLLGLAMAADLIWFGHRWSPQCDPKLYYPRIPVLDQIARSERGRIVGYDCLPAALAQMHGLRDIRGYDAVDPKRLVSLLLTAANPTSRSLPYAALQWFTPRIKLEPPATIRLPPVLDMLGVGTVIFRGVPPSGLEPAFAGEDYWAMANPRALPRAFVPRRVEHAPDARTRLAKLGSPDFDGREVAYVEEPIALPAESRGRVTITGELPTRITLAASMETDGLVVLTDLFDPGWRAFRDGEPTPILRVNHAVRGVRLPTGESVLEFRYWPTGFSTGILLAGLGLVTLLAWSVWLRWRRHQESPR
jgi:hypothetical protein